MALCKDKQDLVAEFLVLSRSMTEKAKELNKAVQQQVGTSSTSLRSTRATGRLRGNKMLLEEEAINYRFVCYDRFVYKCVSATIII